MDELRDDIKEIRKLTVAIHTKQAVHEEILKRQDERTEKIENEHIPAIHKRIKPLETHVNTIKRIPTLFSIVGGATACVLGLLKLVSYL